MTECTQYISGLICWIEEVPRVKQHLLPHVVSSNIELMVDKVENNVGDSADSLEPLLCEGIKGKHLIPSFEGRGRDIWSLLVKYNMERGLIQNSSINLKKGGN